MVKYYYIQQDRRFYVHKLDFKIKRIMKLTCFLLCLSVNIALASPVYAQKAALTVKVEEKTIAEVLEHIEKQSEFHFFYNSKMVDINRQVSLKAENKDVFSILEQLFRNTNISYKVVDRDIILTVAEVSGVKQSLRKITGIVKDHTGEPVIGANVVIKGSGTGTITDLNGQYSLDVPEGTILQISYIGYTTLEVPVKDQKIVNIDLREDSQLLQEVVVVGYGTQKKVNLTGSVSSVKVDEKITNRSLTNVSSGLSGLVPGLAVTQSTGMAGRNGADLKIRGLGTVNNANPLIVVDGMPDVDINRINMNDIESISVLKDATSSAVYGSRAANGVVLITTKSGKNQEKTRINFSGSYAFVKPTKVSEFMADYPRALTLEQRRSMTSTSRDQLIFKDGTIDEWMAKGMIDPMRFPNTDWWDLISRNGAIQNYNLSVSGSNDKSNFYISAGIMDEEGLQLNNDFTRYNARMNYDYKLMHNMNIGVRVDANTSKMLYSLEDGFTDSASSNTSGFDIQYAIAGMYPYDPVSNRWGGVMAYGEDLQAYNPLNRMVNELVNVDRQEANGNIYLDWTPIKGLTARVDFSVNYYNQFTKKASMPTGYAYNFQTGEDIDRAYVGDNAGVSNATLNGYKMLSTAQLRYNTTIAEHHDISLMAVYSEEYWSKRNMSASRNDRIHPSLSEIDAALKDIQGTGGSSEAEGLRSLIGRINYAAYDKYLFEANFRYDGSSKFLSGSQYGFFPSVAVGWRFMEEGFIKSFTEKWLSNGKLRVSYGGLGNNSGVGRYEQQETLAVQNYMMGGSIVRGFVNKKMVNRDLSWELSSVLNIGLDLGFFNNRLTTEIDYYDRLTTGMNRPSEMSIHLTGAYSAPRANIGNLRNRGIEANLTWTDKVNDWGYMLNVNASYNATVLEEWSEFLSRGWVYLDMPYHFLYTYQSSGIAQTWDDILNHTPQGAQPGDLLREDLNGDGLIDGKDQKAYPRVQRDRPTVNFAFNGSVSYKGFDLSLLLQGAAGRKDFWLNNFNQVNFSDRRYAASWWHWTNPWNLDNRQGEWPRLGGSGNNQNESSFWLDNLAYLRLKNMQLGYTFPAKKLSKLGVSNLRLYFSAENLATITAFRGLDPEKSGNKSDLYPLNRSFSIGINLGI